MAGERAWFTANTEAGRGIIWSTDGTTSGTRVEVDHLEGQPAPDPPVAAWASIGNLLVVTRYSPEYGLEPWLNDTRTGNSRLLYDVYPGPTGSNPGQYFVLGDTVYFTADDGIHGVELWCADCAAGVATLALDINPGEESSNPRDIVLSGAGGIRAYFVATSGGGPEIRAIENQDFVTIHPPANYSGPWNPVDLRTVDGEHRSFLEFSIQNADGLTSLWRWDGTECARLPGIGVGQ